MCSTLLPTQSVTVFLFSGCALPIFSVKVEETGAELEETKRQ